MRHCLLLLSEPLQFDRLLDDLLDRSRVTDLAYRLQRGPKEVAVGRYAREGAHRANPIPRVESLAGRIAFVELAPFDITEVGAGQLDRLWIRGGFPESFLATNDAISVRWREDFIRTYLERDIPQLGPRIPAETLRRLWTMFAHHQGGLLNAAQLARGLGVTGATIAHYLDLMVDLLLVRRLTPRLPKNVGKRLVRAPKVYVRDSGLVHALLGLANKEAVLGHPILGPSWEGMAIENLLAAAGPRAQGSFYRTSHGAEIDLVLTWPGGEEWAVEIKRSLAPTPERGFHSALADLAPRRALVLYPGVENYRLTPSVEAIGLTELCQQAQTRSAG